MANIIIAELEPAGTQLFQDSESFLNELSDQEIDGVSGGMWSIVVNTPVFNPVFQVNLQITKNINNQQYTVNIAQNFNNQQP